jgi:hypothetical protein
MPVLPLCRFPFERAAECHCSQYRLFRELRGMNRSYPFLGYILSCYWERKKQFKSFWASHMRVIRERETKANDELHVPDSLCIWGRTRPCAFHDDTMNNYGVSGRNEEKKQGQLLVLSEDPRKESLEKCIIE